MFQLNDNITVVFDTFYDRRNGFFFQTNPAGAVRDQAIKDDAQNESWNTVWDVRAHRSDAGYTIEMVIPFKSLRYRNARRCRASTSGASSSGRTRSRT